MKVWIVLGRKYETIQSSDTIIGVYTEYQKAFQVMNEEVLDPIYSQVKIEGHLVK